MSRVGSAIGIVFEKLREFDRMAGMLDMPLSERLTILNVSEITYNLLRSNNISGHQVIKPELDRRLSYALPLMRKLVSNSDVVRLPVPSPLAAA